MLYGKTVLVADDEPGIRELVSHALETVGARTRNAGNGARALKLMEEGGVDLVVLDILMPEKDGVDTIMEIKTRWPEVKVVAISGGGRIGPEDFLRLAEMIGADATLRKPFGIGELVATVSFLLDHGAPGPELAPPPPDTAEAAPAEPRFHHRSVEPLHFGHRGELAARPA